MYIKSVSINVNTHHPSSEVIIAIIITCFNHSWVLLLYQLKFILCINSVNLYNSSKNRNFTRTFNVNLLYFTETDTQIAEQKSVFAFWLFWLRFLHHILSFFSLRCSFSFASTSENFYSLYYYIQISMNADKNDTNFYRLFVWFLFSSPKNMVKAVTIRISSIFDKKNVEFIYI